MAMSLPPQDSTLRLPLLRTAEAERSPAPSPLEDEVIQLFELLRVRLLRYLLSFGLVVPDAEEIIQEVFLSLFQHLQRGKDRRNLRGWVFRVAHNLALKHRLATRQRVQGRGEAGMDLAERQLDPAPNPEEQVASSQRRKRLMAVVRALPEQDQYCLYLRAEGLRYREIAEVLGISLGGVSLSLARSLARLGRADEGWR